MRKGERDGGKEKVSDREGGRGRERERERERVSGREREKQSILHSCVLNEYLPSVHCLLDRLTTNGQASSFSRLAN